MNILVFGGTGAIGKYLVDILRNNKISTDVTSRSKRDSDEFITYLQGNAHDLSFIKSICKLRGKYDAIIDFMSYDTEEFETNIDTLLNSTNQYIYISSSRVYADIDHPIKESSPRLLDVLEDNDYLSTDEYALSKARQEDILKSKKHNNYTIVRPYITYGDYRLQLGVLEKEEWLYRALKGRTIVFDSEMYKKITTLTNGFDVASGIFNIIGNVNALGEIIHITNNYLLTWEDVFGIYLRSFDTTYGRKLKIKLVPTNNFLSTRDNKLKYQTIYDRLYNRDFDITKSSQVANVDAFISPVSGLKECIDNFMTNPSFKGINWKFEGIKDRITNEWTPLTEIKGLRSKIQYITNRFF